MILFTVTPDLRKGDLVCVPVDINEPDVLKRKLQNAWPVVSGYDSAGDVWSNVPADDGMGFTCKRLHAYDIDIQIRQGYQFHYYVNGVSISQAEQAALVEEECVWGPG
jgi:hypothetical protein